MDISDPVRVHLFFTQPAAAVALRRALGPAAADRLVEFDAFVPHLRSAADVTATDALLQCRGDAGAPRVISEFVSVRAEHPRGLALASVVTTVDALTLWDMLVAPALYRRRNPAASLVATATQIEHATVVVFTEWTSLAVDDLHLLVSLVGHLNPAATVVLLGADAPLVLDRHGFDVAEASLNRAGWKHVLSGTFAPRSVHARVSTFRYQNLRPFHPGRLAALFDAGPDSPVGANVVRAVGFCQLASRPHTVVLWDQCATELQFAALHTDTGAHKEESLAFGQDIAFFGVDLDPARLQDVLDACVLDDDEFLAGPAGWTALPDPLPRRGT